MALRSITAAGRSQPGKLGRVFDAVVSSIGLPRGDGVRNGAGLVPPQGLVIWTVGKKAARCKLSVGVTNGGAEWSRTFNATHEGVWCTCASWETVKLEALALGDSDQRIAWAWTTLAPPSDEAKRMILVESIQPGTRTIPEGAVGLTPNAADAAFAFITEADAGTPLTIAAPLAVGVFRQVIGDQYTATVANVVCWELGAHESV